MKVGVLGLVVAIVIGIAVANWSSKSDEPAAAAATALVTTAARCRFVSAKVISAIQEGLADGLRLRSARAVRSSEFKHAFLVSADLQGPGLEGSGDIATWVVTSLTDWGPILSAEAVAEGFSDWGMVPGGTVIGADGYYDSQDCARAAAGSPD